VRNSTAPDDHIHHFRWPNPVRRRPFDGKLAEYKIFINSFTQIIAREVAMSNLEKFNYLLHSLKEPITDENYPKALQRLNERFDN